MRPSATSNSAKAVLRLEVDGPDLAVDLLARGETVRVRLRGGCMRPWAFPGDVLEVAPLGRPPRPGMVVLVGCEAFMTHRVIAVAHDRVRTRGDLEESPDAWVARSALLGEVVAVHSARGFTLRLDHALARWAGRAGAPLWRGLRAVVRVARRLRSR